MWILFVYAHKNMYRPVHLGTRPEAWSTKSVAMCRDWYFRFGRIACAVFVNRFDIDSHYGNSEYFRLFWIISFSKKFRPLTRIFHHENACVDTHTLEHQHVQFVFFASFVYSYSLFQEPTFTSLLSHFFFFFSSLQLTNVWDTNSINFTWKLAKHKKGKGHKNVVCGDLLLFLFSF